MTRIPAIASRADLAPEHRHVADDVMAVFGRIRGPFSVLLHSPPLAAALLELVKFSRQATIVPGPLRSLAILAMVRERQSHYVWAAQAAAAQRNGVRQELIDLLRARADPAQLPAEERDIVLYARSLARTDRADQALFDALLARHGTQWLVELTAMMNFYALLAGVTNAFDIPAPPDGDRLPA